MGKEGKREGEKHQCKRNIDWLPLACTLAGDLTPNPGMCPDWELNQRYFALQYNAQSTEPHRSGMRIVLNVAPASP